MKQSTRLKLVLLSGAAVFARGKMLHWGATAGEVQAQLPGDAVLPAADLAATRAISIEATPPAAWPWLVQLGQSRAGFYSYDFLENLIGCDIHTANEINPEWQDLAPGDEVRLHPKGGLVVDSVEPGRSLVLHGGTPMEASAPPFDFTWAFVLEEQGDGSTRLIVRERYQYLRWWAGLMVEPVSVASFIMTEKMLRGIRDRAERINPG